MKDREKERVVQISLPRRRAWAGTAWLIASTASVLLALALGYTLLLWAIVAVAAIGGLLLLRSGTHSRAADQQAPSGAGQVPNVQREVWKADGTIQQALIVPAQAAEGYQTVLTIDGYALVNADGRVVYALNRKARAASAEPVVVTVLDEEAIAY
jgi:hypothetical protein